jgi:protein-tyrosine phosphatase
MGDGQGVREWTRRLAWEGCSNVRDLGGYPTADGRETRWGAVVRADSLAPLTEAGRAALVAYGVRSIVDLRAPEEIAAQPNPFARPGEHGVAYTNVPFIDPAAGPPPPFTTTLADVYARMLDQYRSNVATIARVVARAPAGGVLIHCMGGKDRTGVVCALLLDLVGVPRETIGADYALTAECLRPLEEEYLEHGPGTREERERVLTVYMPRAEVMIEVLDRLDREFGGVQGYLERAGVSQDDLDRLRDRLLSPAPAPA